VRHRLVPKHGYRKGGEEGDQGEGRASFQKWSGMKKEPFLERGRGSLGSCKGSPNAWKRVVKKRLP